VNGYRKSNVPKGRPKLWWSANDCLRNSSHFEIGRLFSGRPTKLRFRLIDPFGDKTLLSNEFDGSIDPDRLSQWFE
jgi:hypothetical protein